MSINSHVVPITAIVENSGQFLFIKRSRYERNMAGKWVFPGGKIENGEDAIQALFRELDEETGLRFFNEVAFLSSYFFLRREDSSSSVGLVFLVKSKNRDVKHDNSIETYRWINPEDIIDYTFSYKEIEDFEKETMITIPGMEVHVRNAIIAMRTNSFFDRNLISVSEYQCRNCSMDKEYLIGLKNTTNICEYIASNIFPHR